MDIKITNQQIKDSFHTQGIKGQNIIIASIDTGVSTLVPFGSQLISGHFNALMPIDSHGTKTASVLNWWCPEAKILVYNGYTQDLSVQGPMINWILADITRRVKIDTANRYIVSMSYLCAGIEETHSLIKELVALNVPVIVAAGNDGEERLNRYPGCWPEPICVAALNRDGTTADFSTWHNEMDFADLGRDVDVIGLDGKPALYDGTSAAQPNVAGKAALVLSQNLQLSEPDLFTKLKSFAQDLTPVGFDPHTGWGFLQIKPKESLSMKEVAYAIDTGLVWPKGKGNIRKTTDHIQIHHTVGNYGTPAKWAALQKSKIEKDGHKGVGYSYLVLQDGTIYLGRGYNYSHGAVKDSTTNNANQRSISIALDGDMRNSDLPTTKQFQAAIRLTKDLMAMYNLQPKNVLGHNEVPLYSNGKPTGKLYPTLCPSIDMNYFRAALLGEVEIPQPSQRVLHLADPLMRGDDVKELQGLLLEKGFSPGKIDGSFGPNTDMALRAYQMSIGVTINGIVDEYIWDSLRGLIAEPIPPAEPEPEPETYLPAIYKYAGASYTNVREGPGTSFVSIGKLSAGEECIVLDSNNGWVDTVLHNQAPIVRGWCSDKYLRRA